MSEGSGRTGGEEQPAPSWPAPPPWPTSPPPSGQGWGAPPPGAGAPGDGWGAPSPQPGWAGAPQPGWGGAPQPGWTGAPTARRGRGRAWAAAIGALLLGLFAGIVIGAAATEDSDEIAEADDRAFEAEEELRSVRAELARALEGERGRAGEPAVDPAATFTAGSYSFTDVQASCSEFDGALEALARVTNDGGDVESVGWTLTFFDPDGSVAGTATANAEAFAAGATRTLEFYSSDACSAVDSVELQVDYES